MSNQKIIDILNKFPKPEYFNYMRDIDYAFIISFDFRCKKDTKILLKAGANINTIINGKIFFSSEQYVKGDTYLHLACRLAFSYSRKDVKILLKYGANPNIQNNCGYTPLMVILSNRRRDIKKVNLLIDAGTSIKLQNKEGETALMLAVKYFNNGNINQLNLIEKLIELDPSQLLITDNEGKKAIDYSKDTFIKELLRRKEKEYELYMIYKGEMIYPYLKNILYDDIAKFILSYLF